MENFKGLDRRNGRDWFRTQSPVFQVREHNLSPIGGAKTNFRIMFVYTEFRHTGQYLHNPKDNRFWKIT